jgi:sarcosine oxidase subunit alpha
MRGSREIRLVFEGRPLVAREGDTVAAALVAHGVRVFGRSSKYHRPRGLRCGNGTCSCCAMRVDGLPGVRTCVTPARDGMVVEREHAWPTAEVDLLRGAELAAPLLHAGFSYEWFRRSPRLWSATERALARAAGQGALPSREAARRLAGARLLAAGRVEVLVAGGGLAGMSAALAAADGGAEVMLVERHAQLGGAVTVAGADAATAAALAGAVTAHPHIRVLHSADVAGWYDEELVVVVAGDDLLVVEPAAVVMATGAHERVLPFRGGDLPGVLTAGAARRLLRGGVRPGRAATVVTDGDEGYVLAGELDAAGVRVACVADLRSAVQVPEERREELAARRIPCATGLCDMVAQGHISVRGVRLRLRADGPAPLRLRVACDTLCFAAGGRPATELARQGLAEGRFVLGPVGATTAGVWERGGAGSRGLRLFAAGSANGCDTAALAASDGEAAGRAAAGLVRRPLG